MAQRDTQDYLSSGEITEIYIGANKVLTEADVSYCSYELGSEIQLTNTWTKISNVNAIISPSNVAEASGTFTVSNTSQELWYFTFERVYRNEDSANIVNLSIRLKYNGVEIFTRTMPIGAATGPSEPSAISFNTARLTNVNNADYFEFEVKAENTDTSSPSDTYLSVFEVTAHTIG